MWDSKVWSVTALLIIRSTNKRLYDEGTEANTWTPTRPRHGTRGLTTHQHIVGKVVLLKLFFNASNIFLIAVEQCVKNKQSNKLREYKSRLEMSLTDNSNDTDGSPGRREEAVGGDLSTEAHEKVHTKHAHTSDH
jgi:hypothetical protein